MSQPRLQNAFRPVAVRSTALRRDVHPRPHAITAPGAPLADVRVPDMLAPAMLGLLALAAVALLSLPAARGYSAAVGWMPLWLAGLPASAWLALWLGRRRDRRQGGVVANAPRRRRGPAAVPVAPRRRTPAPQRAPGRRAA